MSRSALAAVVFAFALGGLLRAGEPTTYQVAWDTPSEDSDGTMPLGNGEVAVNAWIEPSGDLRFYIARTDSWDDNGRLVKVGSVRIRSGQPSADPLDGFRQSLDVKTGTLSARFRQGGRQVGLQLWVDAHRPVICVELQTDPPAEAAALVELWRTKQETLPGAEVSDIYAGRKEPTVVEPDTVLSGLTSQVGWFHRNVKSVGPELCAKIQGVADFARQDPLLGRTFGALVGADKAHRPDDRTLRRPAAAHHVFEIYVHTAHPATAESWLSESRRGLEQVQSVPLESRRAAHCQWWSAFWERSWIHITPAGEATRDVGPTGFPPANKLPLLIGRDQSGGSRFSGSLGRVSLFDTPLTELQVQQLAAQGPEARLAAMPAPVYSGRPESPTAVPELASVVLAKGLTIEAWIKPAEGTPQQGMRIVDKITPGGSDGFLLDTHPGGSLRAIVGSHTVQRANLLRPGQWQHVAATAHPAGRIAIYLDGKPLQASGNEASALIAEGSDAAVVSRAYALQRYVAACAGRGRYPIKFNGSLFTVPNRGQPGDADYRRWGPGYWWQNTRLPYYAMCAAGDFEMMMPLFQMYARDLMPLGKFRTRRYLGHDGVYIPECIYFWGDMFTETYGWQPFDQRKDKLQASGWHKWEWVSGLELVGLLLDYYEHTGDEAFLKDTVLPAAHEILTFFDQHYQPGADGKLHMHPAQALETWWDCVNPMPEVAGLHAAVSRLARLPERLTTDRERAFWDRLQAKLPPLPVRSTEQGKTALAAAAQFKDKRNIENPELYAVFPFRLVSLEKPNRALGLEALATRQDRGALGWRQDEVFMAYLGLADQAQEYLVRRARSKHAASRFPVFWGPNYDWVPDQDHGSMLLKAVQSMLLQTDGRQILLLPAWPKDWNADFKLHAPFQTTVRGTVQGGKLVRLDVQPESRRQDVKIAHSP